MVCGVRKQLTNSGAAAGTDLDSIFKPRTSAAGANVSIRAVSGTPGQDLAQRFEPRGTSPKVADVGYRTPGGVDISNVFMDNAYNPVATIAFGSTYSHFANAPAQGSLRLDFLTDGTWKVFRGGSTQIGTGDWLTAAGGGAASSYAVRFTQTITGGAGSVSPNGAGSFLAVSVTRSASAQTVANDTFVQTNILAEVRRVSDSVVVAQGTTSFNADTSTG